MSTRLGIVILACVGFLSAPSEARAKESTRVVKLRLTGTEFQIKGRRIPFGIKVALTGTIDREIDSLEIISASLAEGVDQVSDGGVSEMKHRRAGRMYFAGCEIRRADSRGFPR